MSELISLSSIPSLPDYDPDSPECRLQMSWNIELPGSVDTDRISIDARHLRRLQNIASFEANHVYSFEGQTTEYDYGIKGINNDGTGIAGISMKSKAPEDDKKTLIDDNSSPWLMNNYFSTTVNHTLNKGEMAQKVVNLKTHKGLSSDEAWARELDDHLQRSMRSAALKHLMGRVSLIEKIFDISFVGYFIGLAGQDIAHGDVGNGILSVGALVLQRGMWIGFDSARAKDSYGESFIKNRRLSLFENIQPDRYLAMSALTHINSLVKVKK